MPQFFLDAGVKKDGKIDLGSRPERPQREGMNPTRQDVLDFMTESSEIARSDPTAFSPDNKWDHEWMRNVVMSRAMEAREPSPTSQTAEPLSERQRMVAQDYEATRLRRGISAVDEIVKRDAENQAFRQHYPELAERIGMTDKWRDQLQDAAKSVAHRGWKALDFLLRNFDRPRGSIAAYQLAIQQGMSSQQAQKKAQAVLLGSERGWVFMPDKQAPSFREVLVAAGHPDSKSTTVMGFGLDVLVDPINLLGVGAARHGLEIGSHQILNKFGREIQGKMVRKNLDDARRAAGVFRDEELATEVFQAAHVNANEGIRKLINENREKATEYLDMGGLKIAGFTLPGSAFVLKREAIRGGVQFDYVAEGLATMFGRGTMRGMDRLGVSLKNADNMPITQKLGQFVAWIPDNLRAAGKLVGSVFNRTTPGAGKEYGWFKQAEYYDKLGYHELEIKDSIAMMFRGIKHQDLIELPFAIEAGPEAVEQLMAKIGKREGMKYVQQVDGALQKYRARMDQIILDEVDRGFLKREWQIKPATMQQFRKWVETGTPVVDDKLMKEFRKVRFENYVPHVYHNAQRALRLQPPDVKPRPPSITEPFLRRRLVPTLQDAIDKGLSPETNLAAIASVRMIAHTRATVTHDFLEQAVEKFGANRSGVAGAARRGAQLAGEQKPQPLFRDVLQMRVDAFGKVIIPLEEQIEIARSLAIASNVPPHAVARLDDQAISEFLRERLRITTAGKAERVWHKYVERATERELYDGYALAPARDEANAIALAREMVDPYYPTWSFVKAGGKEADPETLGKMLFPSPIAEDLERLNVRPPEEFRRMIRGYDYLNFWWKRNVTMLWPAFHVRNKITNLINSAADIGLVGIMDRSAMYGIIQGGKGALSLPNNVKMSYSQIRQLARRHGVVRASYRRADIADMIQDLVRSETKTAAQLARKLGVKLPGREKLRKAGEIIGPEQLSAPISLGQAHKLGEQVGMVIENSDRMQLFVKSLQRGFSPEQAARRVNEFLFDYDDISRFEKNFVRRFFNPFWTWTRKNLELQMKIATKTPGRFTPPGKLARALSSEDDDALRSDVERELLPQYYAGTYGVRLETAGALSKWVLNPDLPHEDLNRLWSGDVSRTFNGWMASVTPFARDIFETAAKYDFYKGQRRVEFIRGTKVYDFMRKFKGTAIGNWLDLHERPHREQRNMYVDSKKWQQLMWMTAWQFTRAYTTVGKLLDDKQGSVMQRLFNFLTGSKIEQVRPQEEMRRMVEGAIYDREKGMLANLRSKWRDAYDMLVLEGKDQDEAWAIMTKMRSAIDTPTVPAEVPMKDTFEWDEAE